MHHSISGQIINSRTNWRPLGRWVRLKLFLAAQSPRVGAESDGILPSSYSCVLTHQLLFKAIALYPHARLSFAGCDAQDSLQEKHYISYHSPGSAYATPTTPIKFVCWRRQLPNVLRHFANTCILNCGVIECGRIRGAHREVTGHNIWRYRTYQHNASGARDMGCGVL